jgi:hypothetical protein
MPIFQYQNYTNPYGPSIAEALQHQGDIQAAGALRAGDLEGEAARQQGAIERQMWGGLGQGIAAIPQQMQANREAALRDQALRQQTAVTAMTLEDRQRQRDADTQIGKLLDATPRGPNGTYDVRAFTSNLPGDLAKYAQPYIDHLNSVNSAWDAEDAKQRGQFQQSAAALFQAGAPFLGTQSLIDTGERNRVLTTDQATSLRKQLLEDPGGATGVLKSVLAPQKPITKKDDESLVNPVTLETVAPSTPDPAKGAYTIGNQRFNAQGQPIGAPVATPPTADERIASLFGREATGETLNAADKAILEGWKLKEGSKPFTVKTVVNGRPVEQVMTTADAMKQGLFTSQPPASVTIHNAQQTAVPMPAWALDDSRPAGTEANVLDASIRMTPNGLQQAALNYIANGQFPPTGRGSDPIAVAQRAAITSKVGAIAAASGLDEPALRAFYKANGQSLGQQQKMQDAVQGFMATADKNAALLQESLKKIPDTGSPLFNQPLRAFTSTVAGDPNLSQFATYLQSVQNEYGRIISQPNLAGQLTDSARHEAETLARSDATVPQLLASLQALQNEGTNRLVSVGEQIQRIQQRMQAGPGGAAPGAGGRTRVVGPDGQTGTVPAGTALPPGWKAQ